MCILILMIRPRLIFPSDGNPAVRLVQHGLCMSLLNYTVWRSSSDYRSHCHSDELVQRISSPVGMLFGNGVPKPLPSQTHQRNTHMI